MSELNVRLEYIARALRNTTCLDATSACFRSQNNRFGVLYNRMPCFPDFVSTPCA